MSEAVGPEDIVVARDLARSYRAKRGGEEVAALRGLNLRVTRGSVVAIRGDSGSGKTTLLSLLGGMDVPDSGTLVVDGVDLVSASRSERTRFRAASVGFVFQSYYLLPTLSALENVELAMEPRGVPASARRERALEVLRHVGMRKRADHRPAELSGGEQQRVGIARALANDPPLVLADEPTGNLDPKARGNIIDFLLRAAFERGTTVIMVTHDQFVADRCDVEHKIKDGRITKTRVHSGPSSARQRARAAASAIATTGFSARLGWRFGGSGTFRAPSPS